MDFDDSIQTYNTAVDYTFNNVFEGYNTEQIFYDDNEFRDLINDADSPWHLVVNRENHTAELYYDGSWYVYDNNVRRFVREDGNWTLKKALKRFNSEHVYGGKDGGKYTFTNEGKDKIKNLSHGD